MITLVQSKANTTGSGTAASLSLTLDSPASAGNLLVAVGNSDALLTGPSGFTEAASAVASQGFYLWYRVAAGGESTFTITPSVTDTAALVVREYSGASATPLDKVASLTRSTAAASQATGTTAALAASGELVVVAVGPHGLTSGAPISPSWGTAAQAVSVATSASAAADVAVILGDYTAAGTGAQGDTCAWSNATSHAGGIVATFLPGGTTQTGTGTLAVTDTLTGSGAAARSTSGTLALTDALTGAGAYLRVAGGTLAGTLALTGAAVATRLATGVRTIVATLTGSASTGATTPTGAAAALSKWFAYPIVIERYAGATARGPAFDAAVTVLGMVDPGTKWVSAPTGETVLSSARVFLPSGTADVPAQSRVTLPAVFGGSVTRVITSASYASTRGTPDHLEVTLA